MVCRSSEVLKQIWYNSTYCKKLQKLPLSLTLGTNKTICTPVRARITQFVLFFRHWLYLFVFQFFANSSIRSYKNFLNMKICRVFVSLKSFSSTCTFSWLIILNIQNRFFTFIVSSTWRCDHVIFHAMSYLWVYYLVCCSSIRRHRYK